jgi:hypothetical protein
MKDTKEINAYGFAEFCREVQSLFEQGYKFDFESNAGFPTAFGTFFNAILIKEQTTTEPKVEPLELQVQETTQHQPEVVVEAPAKAGRPKKL